MTIDEYSCSPGRGECVGLDPREMGETMSKERMRESTRRRRKGCPNGYEYRQTKSSISQALVFCAQLLSSDSSPLNLTLLYFSPFAASLSSYHYPHSLDS